MSTRNHAHHNRQQTRKSRNKWFPLVAASVVAVAVLAAGGWFFTGNGKTGVSEESSSAGVPLPIANTPQTVLGLQIVEPAVDRGRLPLDTTVTQFYEIVNTGAGAAEFGKPTIEVLEGCCPPQVQMTRMVVGAGQTASVGFSTQMHPGMDGPHLFHLTVPVRTAEGQDAMHLYFKGDFR